VCKSHPFVVDHEGRKVSRGKKLEERASWLEQLS
jgi:hypothetical protein